MGLICDRSCAPECKSGIQGLAIIRLRTGSDICGYMGVRQKLGMILENKAVQKLKLENMFFTKNGLPNWYSSMTFFEKNPLIFDIDNWLWKYDFGTFWRTIIHCRIVLKQFPLSMSILGQNSCILGPTSFKIPQLNWPKNRHVGSQFNLLRSMEFNNTGLATMDAS